MQRTLTGIYAHPDDETFSGGGTFARYTAAGVRCTLYCATDGQAGKTSGLPVSTREELGALRRRELTAAAEILGIATVESPGHMDGALGAMDQDVLIGEIVAHIRREKPDVVITFGPEGAPNTHPDHRVISRAATAAFFLAALPTAYASQVDGGWPPHRARRLFYVSWADPAPGAMHHARAVPATVAIDVRAWQDTKWRAFRAHASQQVLEARFVETSVTDDELFALAAGEPQPAAVIDDLFAGLDG